MVRVTVNGRVGSFLVDTGAGVTIVHAPYLKSFGLGLAAGGRAAGTLTGVVQFTPVDVARFAIGDTSTQLSRIYARSEEHTSELQSLMRISYAVFCLKKKNTQPKI